MKKRKIILISAAVIVIIAVISVFAPVSVDKFLWGDNFKDYIMEYDLNDLRYLIAKENFGNFEGKSEGSYYYNLDDAYGLVVLDVNTVDFDYETQIKKSISWSGRKIYMSAFFEYKGEIHEIKFEGTRWFFGQYSWEMLDNEFFPIEDENFINTPEVVQKTP